MNLNPEQADHVPSLDDLVVVGARVTYMLAMDRATGEPVQLGEFPHCAVWVLLAGATQCEASMNVTEEDGESLAERCTREAGHHGPHVVHVGVGAPVLAWLVDPMAGVQR